MGGVFLAEIAAAGLVVGVVFGLFGAGGSAFATPLLALLGVPPVLAVASPLPAMVPASVVGARRYLRAGRLDRRLAGLAVAGGLPGTIVGALASALVGGDLLLLLSGLMLVVVAVRLLMPDPRAMADRCVQRRARTSLVLGASFGVGLLTGLLANGGGFLLVPLFIVGFGLLATEAAGTSMVAVGALTVPTVLMHSHLGHIDWPVAVAFAAGLIPASLVGARWSLHLPASVARRAFAVMLLAFALWFLATRVL